LPCLGESPIWDEHKEAAEQLLQQALQQAALQPSAAAPGTAASSSTASAAPHQQQQQQKRQGLLCLDSFSASSNSLGVPSVLAALPAHSLTSLVLGTEDSVVPAELSAALARFSNLQQLRLISNYNNPQHRGGCLAGIAQLTRLTFLDLDSTWRGVDQPLQQLLAQPLPLRKLRLHDMRPMPVLDLQHCTQLTELDASFCGLLLGSLLPAQLQRLHLGESKDIGTGEFMSTVSSLQHLQYLNLRMNYNDPNKLLQLSQMPALQHIALECYVVGDVLEPVWPKLPLRELVVRYSYVYSYADSLQQMLTSAAACKGVTGLELSSSGYPIKPWHQRHRPRAPLEH
jgi:hypothetical protein